MELGPLAMLSSRAASPEGSFAQMGLSCESKWQRLQQVTWKISTGLRLKPTYTSTEMAMASTWFDKCRWNKNAFPLGHAWNTGANLNFARNHSNINAWDGGNHTKPWNIKTLWGISLVPRTPKPKDPPGPISVSSFLEKSWVSGWSSYVSLHSLGHKNTKVSRPSPVFSFRILSEAKVELWSSCGKMLGQLSV